eukprot:COSAG03_NODE_1463_length_4035_cov_427.068852_4_plen_58_part_00
MSNLYMRTPLQCITAVREREAPHFGRQGQQRQKSLRWMTASCTKVQQSKVEPDRLGW